MLPEQGPYATSPSQSGGNEDATTGPGNAAPPRRCNLPSFAWLTSSFGDDPRSRFSFTKVPSLDARAHHNPWRA